MADKPQQQTLSVRISESLRARLERARKLASKSGEAVSTSEIAKQLLESAREDRLEVVNLLTDPTEALLQIRRKGEAQHPLSQAEWTLLAHFVQEGVEAYSAKTPNAVSRESLAAILDAFLAVYALRGDHSSPADAYYLGNLPIESRPPAAKRGAEQITPDLVRRTATDTRKRVSDPDSGTARPIFAARMLYRVLEDTSLGGPAAVNRALRPWWPILWRLAARGHYALTGQPVREPVTRQDGFYQTPLPPITEHPFTLSFARGEATEFSVLLSLPGIRQPLYPIIGYPRIAEFRAMLSALVPLGHPRSWTGEYFFGYVQTNPKQPAEVWFRANDNGITFGFSVDEWIVLDSLFRRAWESQDIRRAWDHLTLEYGEL
ncbi:MAG: hypothetical protein ABJA98_17125 [Acidobacteriota bacterium]